MYIDLSSLFHESSKDLNDKGAVHIPKDAAKWPDEWKTVYYKSYPRCKKIRLTPQEPNADLFKAIRNRHSSRTYAGPAIPKATLSTFLQYTCGITKLREGRNPTRAHPSGGGRFPIEVYPIVFKGTKSVPAGLYHYNVKAHALDVLWQRTFTKENIAKLFVYDWVGDASFVVVMTAVFKRNQMKYGERGYRYILLEAGHIGENMYLVAEALGLKCCGMTGTRDKNLEALIDIDGITESVVHSMVFG